MSSGIISSVVGSAASSLIGNIFGGGGGGGGGGGIGLGARINTPGFDLNVIPDNFGLITSLTRNNSFANRLRDERLPRVLSDLDALRGEVKPGFGALTDAVVTAIQNAKSTSLGSLKDQLARRRTEGSSFGQSAKNRLALTFAQAEAQGRAQSKLQELEVTRQIIQQETNLVTQQLELELREFEVASGVVKTILGAVDAAGRQRMALAAQAAEGSGNFFQQLGGPVGAAIGKSVGGLFDNFSFNESIGGFAGSGSTADVGFGPGVF